MRKFGAIQVRDRHLPDAGALILALAGFLLLGMRQAFTVPLTFGQSMAQAILAVCGAFWVLTRIAGARSPSHLRLLTGAMALYLLASLVSYGAAMARGLPPKAVVLADRYVFADLTLASVVFFIITVVHSRRALELVLKGLVLGGTISGTFALVQFGIGIDLAPQFRLPGLKAEAFTLVTNLMREGLSRPQGSAGHPLELSAVLTVLVPLALGVTFSARARGARYMPWAACTLILTAGALVTISRSAVIGLGAAVLVMCWRWPVKRMAALLVGTGTVLGLAALAQTKVVSALVSSFANSSSDSSIASRAVGARYVSDTYREHLWFGQGVGSYPALDQPVLDSQYLSRLMETGLIGLVSYLVFLFVPLILAIRGAQVASRSTAELSSAIAGSLIATIVIGLILDTAGFAQIWYLTWLLIALAGAAWRLSKLETQLLPIGNQPVAALPSHERTAPPA
ncbi:O-antigen ligase family protein [Antrihabitans sp. YC3-6]|uniref:O-antigen ligase family protein n=1 Tax=Antrihabitans stalagmiti TaxID=2799499 RepID=A0A934NSG3_9NOCA|nr:O-antigen ligase family protein [Antrihabitans stalagmiti]MBJ8340474.1 O-antigen ligase family protein [Antrihabitans stalagmiti]